MVTWNEKLLFFGVPSDLAQRLSPILEELDLCPDYYRNPFQLGRDLRKLIDQRTKSIYVRGEWQPLAWYDPIADFFRWLWEQIKPWMVDVGLIGLGALITWLAGSWYKAIGVIPMGIGIYDILVKTGVISPIF